MLCLKWSKLYHLTINTILEKFWVNCCSVCSCSSSADSSRRRFKQSQFRTQEYLWWFTLLLCVSSVLKCPVVPSQHSPVLFLRGRIVLVKIFSKLVSDLCKVWRQKCRWKIKGIIFSATCFTPSFRSPEALISCWAPFDYSESYHQPLSFIQQCNICSSWTSSKLLL
jgi:hypothetical protein